MKTRFAIHSEEGRCKLAIECRVAQLAIDKGVKSSRDGTRYSEFLAQVQSQPKVWQAVKHAQKSLPRVAFESIQAMFSDEKEEFFESVDFFESAEAMPVFAGTSFEREGADSSNINVITLASGTIREGANSGSREGAGNGPSGAKRKYVPAVASSSNSSQISGGASKLPWALTGKYRLSDLDWGSNYDDEIDWADIAARRGRGLI